MIQRYKVSLCFAVLLGCLWSSVKAQAVELTDRKDLLFATNVANWTGITIDSLLFDVYYPTGATSDKKYPVYFCLHGGSFITATKQSVSEFSDGFADYGYVVIAPDYRVGYASKDGLCQDNPDSLREAIYRAVQDVNSCIRYVTNHADDYNIDTSNVFVGGASAGGTLTLNLAYITDSVANAVYPQTVARWGGVQSTGNTEPYNYKIKGLCVQWGGVPEFDSLINSRSAIPSILFKGGLDTNLPNGVGYFFGCPNYEYIRAGQGIYDRLTALHTPCVFHFQPYAPHSAYDNDFCERNTNCFFKGLMANKPYSSYHEIYEPSCQ